MIDQPFREILPRFAEPLVALYKRLGVTPNQISLASVGIAAVAAVCVALGWTWLAVAVWWAGRLLDGTDGIYARATGQVSDFGGYVDIVCDMASYSMMILGFAAWRPDLQWVWSAIVVLYVLCITSALALGSLERARGLERDDRSLRLAAGLAEGGETGIAYTLFLLLPGALPFLAILWLLVLITTVVARTLLAKRLLA